MCHHNCNCCPRLGFSFPSKMPLYVSTYLKYVTCFHLFQTWHKLCQFFTDFFHLTLFLRFITLFYFNCYIILYWGNILLCLLMIIGRPSIFSCSLAHIHCSFACRDAPFSYCCIGVVDEFWLVIVVGYESCKSCPSVRLGFLFNFNCGFFEKELCNS